MFIMTSTSFLFSYYPRTSQYYPQQIRRLSITNTVFGFKRPAAARRKKSAVSPCDAMRTHALFIPASISCSVIDNLSSIGKLPHSSIYIGTPPLADQYLTARRNKASPSANLGTGLCLLRRLCPRRLLSRRLRIPGLRLRAPLQFHCQLDDTAGAETVGPQFDEAPCRAGAGGLSWILIIPDIAPSEKILFSVTRYFCWKPWGPSTSSAGMPRRPENAFFA